MIIESNDKLHHFVTGDRYFKLFDGLGKRVVEDDTEKWGAFTGGTGCGKSVRGQQAAYISNGRRLLKLKNICFDKTEFIQAILDAQKGDVIIGDEAISIAFNRASMTKDGRVVAEIANQIRQKNLIVFLCVPDLLNLDFVILNKLNFIVEVSESKRKIGQKNVTIKGNARVFVKMPGHDQVSHYINYLKIKKSHPGEKLKIPIPQPFCLDPGSPVGEAYAHPWYPIEESEADYRAKKESVLQKYLPKNEENKTPVNMDDRTAYILKETMGLTWDKIANTLNRPISTVRSMVDRYKLVLNPKQPICMPPKDTPKKEDYACENVVSLKMPPL